MYIIIIINYRQTCSCVVAVLTSSVASPQQEDHHLPELIARGRESKRTNGEVGGGGGG